MLNGKIQVKTRIWLLSKLRNIVKKKSVQTKTATPILTQNLYSKPWRKSTLALVKSSIIPIWALWIHCKVSTFSVEMSVSCNPSTAKIALPLIDSLNWTRSRLLWRHIQILRKLVSKWNWIIKVQAYLIFGSSSIGLRHCQASKATILLACWRNTKSKWMTWKLRKHC